MNLSAYRRIVFALATGGLLVLVAIFLVTQPGRAAGPWYVAPGGDDGNDCLSPGAACATINGAIAKAGSGDIIYVAIGTYTGTGDEVVLLDRDITLSGGWDGSFTTQAGSTTIDGEGSRRGVTVSEGVAAVVERLVIHNGYSDEGGGVYNYEGTLTLSDTIVRGNAARRYAGGISNRGALILNSTIVSDNGIGGIRTYGGSALLNNSAVRDNMGTGIRGGLLTLNSTTVSGNAGSGISIGDNESVTLNHSSVSDNVGIGIDNWGGTVTLYNSTVSGNKAGGIYGHTYWHQGTVHMTNCTITGNIATEGGGMRNSMGAVTMQNTILAGNMADSGPNCSGTIDTAGYNLVGDLSGCDFEPGPGDQVHVDAMLGQLIGAPEAPRYHPLLAGSLVADQIPTGTNGCGGEITTDQRGISRPQGPACDVGAYEYAAVGPAAHIYAFGGSPQTAAPFSTFRIPLQSLVLDGSGSPVHSVSVTFSAPASGPSGVFADTGTHTATVVTDESGLTAALPLVANGLVGSYVVTATVSNVVTPAGFPLHNTPGWYVAPDGNDSNSCLSAHAPCATINAVPYKSGFVAGDTVMVATGTYTATTEQALLLSKAISLSGGWDRSFATHDGISTIDAELSRRGIVVEIGVTAIIERFAIRNGAGGIYNAGTLTLNHCIVSDNTDNGIGNVGTLTLNNCTVSGNAGSGINNHGTLVLNNCSVSDNRSDGDGGGIATDGAILTLNNSTISGNSAGRWGGGIQEGGGIVTLNNCTITGNAAGLTGGGIDGDARLQNTILAGNTANVFGPDCSSAIDSSGYNLIGDTSDCNFNPSSGDLTELDANLGPLTGALGVPGYHPLRLGSPAINAGNPAGCTDGLGNPLATDQRGLPRFQRCDIGAFELQPIGFATKTVNWPWARPGSSLTYTIALPEGGGITTTRVRVTDTLPLLLTYTDGTLSATEGSYGFHSGVITWTGQISAGKAVTITYGATVNPTLGSLANLAIIRGAGETITRTATVKVSGPLCNLTKSPGNPVLPVGSSGAWDADDVWNPSVLREGTGYRMWYTGDDGTDPSRIGLATSSDGIVWTKSPANPVMVPSLSWEEAGISAGSVISNGSYYQMWYSGLDSNGVNRIGYATSPDGFTWSKHGNPVLEVGAPGSWDDDDVSRPAVIKQEGVYSMWYGADDGLTARIGRAQSSDGIVWNKDPGNPVLDVGPPGEWDWLEVYAPSVVALNDVYLLWYSAGTLPSAWQTGYATSSDGSHWSHGTMLLPEGPLGSFDADSADYASVIAEGGGFELWYSGVDQSGVYNIGYATAEICDHGGPPPISGVYLPIVMRSPNPCAAYYTDDFSNPHSGWPVHDDSDVRSAYTGGQYQIWLKKPSLGWSVTPGAKATDFAAEVSARRSSGSGGLGIIFGINSDWSEYYEYDVSDEYYSIWRYDHGTWTALRDWTYSSHIQKGTNWNRLKVVRQGTDIAVYVNGLRLVTIGDGSFTGLRRIGLLAFSFGDSSFDARFDDFALYPESCDRIVAGLGFEMGQPGTHKAPPPPGPEQGP